MRKKFFLVLSVLVCALCCALGLAGCDLGNSESGNTGNSSNNGSNHTHSYQWVDNGDGTHKQHCSKTGCDAPDKNKESHVWDKNNKCQKCDAENSGIVIKECLHTDSLWHVTDSKESTCEKPGYTLDIYVCKGTVNEGKGERMCGKVFADENAAKTDTFIGILDEKQFDSKNCFNVYRKTLPLSDHTPVTDAAVPATCTQKGLTEGSHCSVCKEALKAQQETDFADHSYTSSVTLQETVLSKYNVCSVCGKVENKDVKYSARLNDDEKSYTIVSITGSEIGATLYVPKSYNDKPVIAIGEQACYNDDCAKITNANIPEGIELIGDFAFTNCGSLSEVTIPRSVTSIGKYAFYGCHGITEIAIPQSITRIEEYTFYECSNLKKVEIAESVSYVSYLAFSECPIETATIPAGIISAIKNSALRSVEIISGDRIGSYAFSGCINLASITLPESVIKLDYSSFESCDNLTVIRYMGNLANWCEISGLEYLMKSNRTLLINGAELTGELVIPKGVTQISSYAFSGCNKIVSVEIPDSVTDVGYGAFYNCPIESAKIPAIACPVISNSALKTVEITSGKTIPDNAFKNCSELIDVTISESVETIGKDAFSGCCSLTEIEISASVNDVGDDAFSGCTLLESITVNENNTAYMSKDGILYDKSHTKFIHIPKAVKGSVEILSGIAGIKDDAFNKFVNLTEIIIPESVTYIGNFAFFGCTNLKCVTIPDSVNRIGDRAFMDCPISIATLPIEAISSISTSELESVVLTSGTTIGSQFEGCTTLTDITLPDSLEYISQSFAQCNALTKIYYSGDIAGWCKIEGLGRIMNASRTLYINGEELAGELIIPQGVTAIGNYAFVDRSNIASISLPNGVTKIGESAFNGCNGISEIAIPNSVTEIGAYAFSGCNKITSVIIPDSVTDVGYGIFSDCPIESLTSPTVALDRFRYSDTLETVTITSGEWIDSYALSGCSKLTSITLPQSLQKIYNNAFEDCKLLTSIYYTGNITSWCEINGLGYLMTSSRTLYINDEELTGELIIPKGITTIGANAFLNCNKITSISLPADLIEIGAGAFGGCDKITTVTIPDSVTSIGIGAFGSCPIESATIPAIAIASVKNSALTDLTITSGDSIPDNALKDCESLTSLTIADSVKSVGTDAFKYCTSFTDVYYNGTIASWCEISGLENLMKSGRTLYINGEELTGDLIIPKGVTSISSHAFYYRNNITSITLSNDVVEIGEAAFAGCRNITSIVIPESVKTVRSSAFTYSSHTNIYYAGDLSGWCSIDGVRYFMKSDSAAAMCTLYIDGAELEGEITIPDGIENIDDCMFSGCRKITGITIPDSVKSIGKQAFYYCLNLANITIPKSVESIGQRAFEYCNALKSVTVEEENTAYASQDGILYDKDKTQFIFVPDIVGAITIPDSVTTIPQDTFYGRKYLTSVTLGNNVKVIGASAFRQSKITSIVIPESVESIGANAFSGCSSLTSITYSGNKEQWTRISKGSSWNSYTATYTVHCSDLDISKSEDI